MQCKVKNDDRPILAGDFNLPNINSVTFTTQSSKSPESEELNIAYDFDLLQVVSEPTRKHDNTESVLDLVFVSRNKTNNISVQMANGISDHFAVVSPLKGTLVTSP